MSDTNATSGIPTGNPPAVGSRPSIAADLLTRLGTPHRYVRWAGATWITVSAELTPEILDAHIAGRETIGVHPASDGVARLAVIDVDLHLDREPTAEEIAKNEGYAIKKVAELAALGVTAVLIRGDNAGSYHILFWVSPMLAERLGRWLREFIRDAGELTIETFPSPDGGGNAIRLPGRHHRRPGQWSAAWDGAGWAPWPVAIHRLAALPDNPASLFPDQAKKSPSKGDGGANADRPGDVFNLSVPVTDVLVAYGWKVDREHGDRLHFTRPGKAGGVSASVMNGTVWVFTSSVPDLPASSTGGKPYTAFAAIAYLEYGGDFRRAARELAQRGFCAGAPENSQAWPDPIPLDRTPDVPPYPLDVLPGWLGEWAAAVALELQVPVDLPAALGLGLVSGGIARKVVVRPRAGFTEPTNQYVMVALPPGDRKSQTFRRAIAPVQALQRDAREAAKPLIIQAESDLRIAEKRVKHLEDRIAKVADPAEREAFDAELQAARATLATLEVPAQPLLYTEDDTAESLKLELVRQDGRLMIATTEAKCIENISLYSDRPNFDVYLKAHAGDEINSGRIARGRDTIADPALTCLLSPQPSVLRGLAEDEALRGRGFLARWSYGLPLSRVGSRAVGTPAVPPVIQARYDAVMRAAWAVGYAADPEGSPTPHVLTFDPGAAEAFVAFERWLEPQLAPGQPLARLAGWANKLNGACARVAAALHIGDRLGHRHGLAQSSSPVDGDNPPAVGNAPAADRDLYSPISLDVVRRAIRLSRDYAIPHAIAAFDLMGADATLTGARRVWAWVAKEKRASFSARDAFAATRAAFDSMDELQKCLDLLARHFLVRPEGAHEPRGRGPGRPASPRYEVNPRACPGDDASGGTTGAGGDSPGGRSPDQGTRDGTASAARRDATLTAEEAGPPAHNTQNPQNSAAERPDTVSAYCVDSVSGGPRPEETVGEPGPTPAAGGEFAAYESRAVPTESPAAVRTAPPPVSIPDPEVILVTTQAGVSAAVDAVKAADGASVGLDTETTGLDPRTDHVRLLQIATPEAVYVLDLFAIGNSPALVELFAALAGVEVVGHNLQFDLRFLAQVGFVPGRVYDTMLASQVLHAGRTARNNIPLGHKLSDVCQRELNREVDKTEQTSDWSGDLSLEQIRYAALDAAILLPLATELKAKLEVAKLTTTTDLEMRALPAVAWLAGVPVDRSAWLSQTAKATAERDLLKDELKQLSTGDTNWNSPGQVKAAFATVGITVESTGDEILATVDHPIAVKLREYRGASKRVTCYGTRWADEHISSNRRVYASWWQLSQVTGRIGCSSPNLQQTPKGASYRRCFAAPAGSVLVKADYSQIELRIAARITGDARMLAAYRDAEDIHTLTAATVLKKPATDVSKTDRQLAKALNFGLLYGMGPDTLITSARTQYGVTLTPAEARKFSAAFFATYPGLARWHRSVGNTAIDTRTLGGRRRIGVARYTEKLNSPVQGTGADGLKAAIALLWERRAECRHARPVLYVHDEIVIEVPEADAELTKAWLERAMIDGMAPLIAPVPVEVEVTVGRTWAGD